MLIEYEKRDEISKRNVKHANKNTKYQIKRMYDERIEHGSTKLMTKPLCQTSS
jgi:hypothetical protein